MKSIPPQLINLFCNCNAIAILLQCCNVSVAFPKNFFPRNFFSPTGIFLLFKVIDFLVACFVTVQPLPSRH